MVTVTVTEEGHIAPPQKHSILEVPHGGDVERSLKRKKYRLSNLQEHPLELEIKKKKKIFPAMPNIKTLMEKNKNSYESLNETFDMNSDDSIVYDMNSDWKPPKPYWGFWKVVFAGWLIKYPGKFFSGFLWCLILLGVGVMYVADISGVLPQGEGMREPQNYIQETL